MSVRPGTGTNSRASMREVAQLAGVAMSSVSRVLSGHPDVSQRMRQRVEAAVDELGYQPDMLAQSLRRRATLSVGCLVGEIADPLVAEIVQGAEATLREAGYSLLLASSDRDPQRDAHHVRLFGQRRVDGLLLSLAAEDDEQLIELLAAAEAPAVLLDRELPERAAASSVLSDHRSGVRAAVDHLLDLGHRRIGLVLGQPLHPSRERRRGLEEAYAARGLPPTHTVVEGLAPPDHGRVATRRLLGQPAPPTAIVAGDDQILLGTLAELRERGLRVGEDVALVGCSEIPLTALHTPPIAVVRRDGRELGRQAALLMLRLLDGAQTPERLLLPTAFEPRLSCSPPPAAPPA